MLRFISTTLKNVCTASTYGSAQIKLGWAKKLFDFILLGLTSGLWKVQTKPKSLIGNDNFILQSLKASYSLSSFSLCSKMNVATSSPFFKKRQKSSFHIQNRSKSQPLFLIKSREWLETKSQEAEETFFANLSRKGRSKASSHRQESISPTFLKQLFHMKVFCTAFL